MRLESFGKLLDFTLNISMISSNDNFPSPFLSACLINYNVFISIYWLMMGYSPKCSLQYVLLCFPVDILVHDVLAGEDAMVYCLSRCQAPELLSIPGAPQY